MSLLAGARTIAQPQPEDDGAAATRLLDQAAGTLAHLAADASDASVLLGIPSAAQRQAVHDAAGEALALIDRAAAAADQAVERLQAAVFDAQKLARDQAKAHAAAAEARLAVLVDTEQARRIPLLRARATVLLTGATPPAQRTAEQQQRLRAAIDTLDRMTGGTARPDPALRLMLACALLAASQTDAALRPPAHDQFVALAGGAPGDGATGAESAPRALARLGVLLTSDAERAPPGDPAKAPSDPALALLSAEVHVRVLLTPRTAGGTNGALADEAHRLTDAFAPLLALVDRAPAGTDAAARRALVYAKVAAATDARMPFDALPPQVSLARAANSGTSPAARAEAVSLLEPLLARADAASFKPDALWELAVVLSKSEHPADLTHAAATLTTLVRSFPRSPHAADGAAAGVQLGRAGLAAAPAGAARDSARAAYLDALRAAVSHRPAPPQAAAWRYELASLTLADAEGHLTAGALNSVLGILDEPDPPPSEQSLELARRAIARAAEQAQARVSVAMSDRKARQDVIAVHTRAVAWLDRYDPSRADPERLTVAEALLADRDAKALPILARLAAHPSAGTDAVRVRLALGRAQRLSGEAARAFGTLRTLADELDAPSTSPPSARPGAADARPEAFWAAWAEMLEILGADNAGGERTPTIRLQINRLSLIDPALGPEPHRSRIVAIRGALAAR